jgi:hypothetical protein
MQNGVTMILENKAYHCNTEAISIDLIQLSTYFSFPGQSLLVKKEEEKRT